MKCNIYSRSYKTITENDLKFPLVYGEGKRVSTNALTFKADPYTYILKVYIKVCKWDKLID